jgi:hypothetical protein
MNKKWLAALYIIANLLFIRIVAEQWFALRELPGLVSNYAQYSKNESSGIAKGIAQGLFYALGAALSMVVLSSLFKNTDINKKWLLAWGGYFLAFILLELPLYNKHFGWGASHRHSFWYGSHFH